MPLMDGKRPNRARVQSSTTDRETDDLPINKAHKMYYGTELEYEEIYLNLNQQIYLYPS